jgi:hypothetical protein
VEWNGTRGNTFVSVQRGIRRYRIDRGLPGSELFTDQVATVDQITQRVTGMNTNAQTLNFEGRSQTTGVISYYKPNMLWAIMRSRAASTTTSRTAIDRRATGEPPPTIS